MTKYNKSQVTKRAWEIFKEGISFPTYSSRERFAQCLQIARQEARSIVTRAFYEAQAVARQSMSQIDRLKEEISLLQFKSSRFYITVMRRSLEAQIEALAA